MDEMNRRYEFDNRAAGSGLMFFVAGALVGAAAALILAPQSGRDTRAFIGRRGREFADDVAARGKELWNEHGERVTTAVKRGYERAAGTVADAVNGAADAGQAM
jgi:gas vesicle protein